MPPKRRTKQHRIINESDYDTDLNLTDTGTASQQKHAPALTTAPARTNEELNLTVLQRYNPSIHQVLSVAPFAKVYVYNAEAGTWDHGGIEGTLFVCQLLPTTSSNTSLIVERYCVVILNRKSLDNFSVELTTTDDMELTDQYIILQAHNSSSLGNSPTDAVQTVYGLWIFTEPEPNSTARAREITGHIMVECADRAHRSRLLAEASAIGDDEGFAEEDAGYEAAYEEEQPRHEQQQEYFPQPQVAPHLPGQQINLNSLFANGSGGHARQQHDYLQDQYHHQQHPQQRFEQSQAQHYPQTGQPAQSDLLLNLFRNARQS